MHRRILLCLSVLCFILFFAFSLVLIAQSKVEGESGFVGSETCKDCHEGQYNKFLKSVHGKKAVPGNPADRDGCESCHGPGAQHVEKGGGRGVAIFVFSKKESSTARDSKCLGCHQDMRGG